MLTTCTSKLQSSRFISCTYIAVCVVSVRESAGLHSLLRKCCVKTGPSSTCTYTCIYIYILSYFEANVSIFYFSGVVSKLIVDEKFCSNVVHKPVSPTCCASVKASTTCAYTSIYGGNFGLFRNKCLY